MNKLVEEIIKPILEADSKIKKVVGIYGGRFQPFGPHHLKTYKWLQSKVDEAYITTSNIKKPPRHPMNFKEKVRHMSKMGIKSKYIIEEKSPYVAKNLEKKYDEDTTAFVYVFGAKDAGRLGGGGKYFQDYLKNKKDLKGYKEHGYYLVAPHVSISVGGKEVSGTTMRELLGSDKYDDKERAKLFKKMFGYFNQGVFNMMVNKFKKLFEVNESLPNKVTDKFKKLKSKPESETGKDFEKHHTYHSGPHIKGKPAEDDTYDFDDEKDDNEGGLQKDKDKSKRGYEPVKEDNIVTWDNTKPKPKNPKLFDKKKRDLLQDKVSSSQLAQVEKYLDKLWGKVGIDVEFTRHFMDRANDKRNDKPITSAEVLRIFKQTYKKYGKQIPKLGDDAQALMKDMRTDVNVPFVLHWNGKELELRAKTIMRKKNFKSSNRKFAVEGVDLPIKVGDTIMMGRFKNKKVVIKSIDFNDKGDLMINGRPALKFRITKSKEIDEFLINNDVSKIIKEVTATPGMGKGMVDDGPSAMMGGMNGYKGRNKVTAEKIGWSILNYILSVNTDNVPPTNDDMLSLGWPFGPHKSVTYLPAGIGTGKTPNNQENLTGRAGYNKWLRNIRAVAQEVGMEMMKFRKQDKNVVKQMSKDATDTLKKQKEEEKEKKVDIKVEENVFSKEWWDDVITEVSAKTKLFKQKLMRRGIKIRYDKAKAQQDLKQKYAGQGEVVGKKFGLRKAYYAVPKKGFKKDTKPTITITKKEMDKLHTDKQIDKGNLKVLYKEGLLMEGGAYGHMAHPFDDNDLTFGDLKKIITNGLGGQLSREDNVTEKLDGQNIMISFKDGKLIAARNKGHIKNGGKTALDKKGIASKFKGRGDIKNAFVFAMNDLEKAIKSLSDKQKEKIFNNGYNFMNMEVMWPASANVINYDKAELVFHGALKYDDNGKVVGEVPGSGRILAGMIEQRNQNIQKKYKIAKPVFLDVPKHQDFGTMKSKFIGELNKLRNEYGLKDNDTLALYHQSYWEEYIYNTAQQFGYTIPNTILEKLTKRWAFFDKSYKIPTIKTELKDEPKFLEWVLKTDKEDHKAMVKENMKPFETLFFGVGAQILKNVKGFMAANPKKSVQNIRKKLKTSIENVKASGDKKKLNTLKLQLDKLNKIGGVDAIVPSEGIVFKYKGKTYKFTGAFAPINQITGLIYF